ncbi:MAG: alanine--glyoxylate aminotransferase family protein [Deltaproteobacteria bacterium]|nr:MAG: alanine--glyoxylate aminotransferase family protein [Deltaproteobacteria bacterium]
MQTYDVGLVPGPVSVPPELRAAYQVNYGSSDLEEEFFSLYQRCESHLGKILATRNRISIQSGEGMIALWSALKSVLRPGDRVLAVANGVFGYGIGNMARQLGMAVETVGFGYDDVPDPQQVREAAKRFSPRLVTAVHCETPSGTLASLKEIGEICREVDTLFYVDFVSSGGGVEVRVDDWHIDLGLLGSQKVLSMPPDLAMVTVSERAWSIVEEVGYVGYDALAPWKAAVADRRLPYTHNWHAMAGLHLATRFILHDGLPPVFQRHEAVAAYCRKRLQQMGIELFPVRDAICSPTVTAAKVPADWSWVELDQALRFRGLVLAGSYGPLASKVFRIGHMGSQANRDLVERGMDILEAVFEDGK